MLINVDLKQIEICVFAQLCKPKLLVELLNSGQDIHRFIGSHVYDKKEEEITDSERSDSKISSFGIIYGNGARTLSERTGRSFEWCKDFIEEFYTLFPEAKDWHNKIIKQVEGTGQLKLFTGMVLKFKKYPAKYPWQDKNKLYYNPPDIKNHPVQHLAWIITSMILGQFWREKALYKRDKYIMINTVHDSLMIDCKEEYIDECITDVSEIIDRIPQTMLNLWGEKLIVPIKAEFSTGNTWLDL